MLIVESCLVINPVFLRSVYFIVFFKYLQFFWPACVYYLCINGPYLTTALVPIFLHGLT